jgi:hypothetical protein
LNKKDWPLYLPQIIKNLNCLPNKAIGGLRPQDITGPKDDPIIDEAKLAAGKEIQNETHYYDWKSNQLAYNKSNVELKKGNYVYVGFPRDPMYRLKDFQVI